MKTWQAPVREGKCEHVRLSALRHEEVSSLLQSSCEDTQRVGVRLGEGKISRHLQGESWT